MQPSRYLNAFIFDLMHYLSTSKFYTEDRQLFGFSVREYVSLVSALEHPNKYDDQEYDPILLEADIDQFMIDLKEVTGTIPHFYLYLEKILRAYVKECKHMPMIADHAENANEMASYQLSKFVDEYGEDSFESCGMIFDLNFPYETDVNMDTIGDILIEIARLSIYLVKYHASTAPIMFNALVDKLCEEIDGFIDMSITNISNDDAKSKSSEDPNELENVFAKLEKANAEFQKELEETKQKLAQVTFELNETKQKLAQVTQNRTSTLSRVLRRIRRKEDE